MSSLVTTQVADGIATVTMDDGKVNAMSASMLSAINDALDIAEESRAVTILRGRPGIFSAGFDMKTFTKGPEASLEMIRAGGETILRFLSFPYPILTVCEGHAYPMGAFLMLAADGRVGLDGPWQIGLNEVAIAMTLPKFAVELARFRLTPPAFSRANTGYLFSPTEAALGGYFDFVVGESNLEKTVQQEAQRLRNIDMPSFKATKERTNGPGIDAISSALNSEWAEVEQ